MTRLVSLLIFTAMGFFMLHEAQAGTANEQLRAVQEALRSRKLYFGNVDGQPGAETTEAIRRFQERKGFDPTGALDVNTLRALGLVPREGARTLAAERIEEARDFIESYLRAMEKNEIEPELKFYADRVDYFDDGVRDLDFIAAKQKERRLQWPQRKYTVTHFIASGSEGRADEMIATFRCRFVVSDGVRQQQGEEDNTFVIRSVGRTLKIVAMKAL